MQIKQLSLMATVEELCCKRQFDTDCNGNPDNQGNRGFGSSDFGTDYSKEEYDTKSGVMSVNFYFQRTFGI